MRVIPFRFEFRSFLDQIDSVSCAHTRSYSRNQHFINLNKNLQLTLDELESKYKFAICFQWMAID